MYSVLSAYIYSIANYHLIALKVVIYMYSQTPLKQTHFKDFT